MDHSRPSSRASSENKHRSYVRSEYQYYKASLTSIIPSSIALRDVGLDWACVSGWALRDITLYP